MMMDNLDNERVYEIIQEAVYKAVWDFLTEFCDPDPAIESGVDNAFTKQMNQYFECIPGAIANGTYQAMIEQNNKKR